MTDWQPIETAPKDGTKVLAWDGYDWCIMHFVSAAYGWNAKELCMEEPTHWQSLPAPPVKATE